MEGPQGGAIESMRHVSAMPERAPEGVLCPGVNNADTIS